MRFCRRRVAGLQAYFFVSWMRARHTGGPLVLTCLPCDGRGWAVEVGAVGAVIRDVGSSAFLTRSLHLISRRCPWKSMWKVTSFFSCLEERVGIGVKCWMAPQNSTSKQMQMLWSKQSRQPWLVVLLGEGTLIAKPSLPCGCSRPCKRLREIRSRSPSGNMSVCPGL